MKQGYMDRKINLTEGQALPGVYETIISLPNAINLRSGLKFFFSGELFCLDEMAINRFGHISPQFTNLDLS